MILLSLLASLATAQDLQNPGFEDGVAAPWTIYADNIARVEAVPTVAHEGTWVATLVLTGNTGAYEQAGAYQDVNPVAGNQHVRSAAWVRSGDFTPLLGDTVVELVQEHFDGGGAALLRPLAEVRTLPQGEWHCLEVTAQTPADTAFVRTALLLTSPAGGEGGIWLDDTRFELSATPFTDTLCPQDEPDTDEPVDSGTGQGNDDDTGDGEVGSCDCDSGRAPLGVLALLLPLLALRRRG